MTIRVYVLGIAFAAGFGLIGLSGNSFAEMQKDLAKSVKSIADAIKKGDAAGAKKQAGTTAQSIDDIADLMGIFRPESKGGIGLEKKLKDLEKAAIPKGAEESAYLAAAMADLILAKGWPKDMASSKTKKAYAEFAEQMHKATLELAQAKGAKAINAAARGVNNACGACHVKFK